MRTCAARLTARHSMAGLAPALWQLQGWKLAHRVPRLVSTLMEKKVLLNMSTEPETSTRAPLLA